MRFRSAEDRIIATKNLRWVLPLMIKTVERKLCEKGFTILKRWIEKKVKTKDLDTIFIKVEKGDFKLICNLTNLLLDILFVDRSKHFLEARRGLTEDYVIKRCEEWVLFLNSVAKFSEKADNIPKEEFLKKLEEHLKEDLRGKADIQFRISTPDKDIRRKRWIRIENEEFVGG
ncbi:MAG TPA: hypothetical protein ENG45_02005 [Candidatus Aenigmarchaeota archaeon]|nr:hypothetical protein [Candidatus Aenigmarchaeota archaeon]